MIAGEAAPLAFDADSLVNSLEAMLRKISEIERYILEHGDRIRRIATEAAVYTLPPIWLWLPLRLG